MGETRSARSTRRGPQMAYTYVGEGDVVRTRKELWLTVCVAKLWGAEPPRLGPKDSALTRVGTEISRLVST